MSLERYRDVIPDWETFSDTIRAPEPVTIRVRTGRISAEDLVGRLERQGFTLEPLVELPEFWRVIDEPYPVSRTLEHWLGLFYVQQGVMGLAARALGPAPGERVLDLCAAPGGKTSHLADLMGDQGTIVAVEPDHRRVRKLVGNLYRMGHTNVLAVTAEGAAFPGGALFDRVLVDAPCSAEGTLRQRAGHPPAREQRFVRYVTGLQERLLRRAVELTRPGGTVLYATCTFGPEENEAVVDRVLRDTPVTVEAIALDAPHQPGLTAFEGRSFDPALALAWRVYPHHLDSGGLFMARLRRQPPSEREAEPSPDAGWTALSHVVVDGGDRTAVEAERAERLVRDLAAAFQVSPASLEGLRWMVRGKNVWCHSCARWPVEAWRGGRNWTLVSLGVPAFRRKHAGPTNTFLRWLGDALRGRVESPTAEEWQRLLEGQAVSANAPSDGPVALELDGLVVGRGSVRDGRLRHEIGKHDALALSRMLERRR